jgi:hypothetical protein
MGRGVRPVGDPRGTRLLARRGVAGGSRGSQLGRGPGISPAAHHQLRSQPAGTSDYRGSRHPGLPRRILSQHSHLLCRAGARFPLRWRHEPHQPARRRTVFGERPQAGVGGSQSDRCRNREQPAGAAGPSPTAGPPRAGAGARPPAQTPAVSRGAAGRRSSRRDLPSGGFSRR